MPGEARQRRSNQGCHNIFSESSLISCVWSLWKQYMLLAWAQTTDSTLTQVSWKDTSVLGARVINRNNCTKWRGKAGWMLKWDLSGTYWINEDLPYSVLQPKYRCWSVLSREGGLILIIVVKDIHSINAEIIFYHHWKSSILFMFPYWVPVCSVLCWRFPVPTCDVSNLKIILSNYIFFAHSKWHLIFPQAESHS